MNRNRQKTISIALAVALLASSLLIGGYVLDWEWVGFRDHGVVSSSVPQGETVKTLWDWLELLIIPATLALAGLLWNRSERSRERELAEDNQAETRLQLYFDRMSDLLLEKNLRKSGIDDEVQAVAQARTLSTLSAVNATRRASVIRFLNTSKLIDTDYPLIRLTRVDLSALDLRNLDFNHASFFGANLEKSQFHNSDLYGANLSRTSLRGANLTGSTLYQAQLVSTDLENANLENADLTEADLMGAILEGANLKQAILRKATLWNANLMGADLTNTDLRDTDLSGANLSKANLLGAQLDNAYMFGVDLKDAKYDPGALSKAVIPKSTIRY